MDLHVIAQAPAEINSNLVINTLRVAITPLMLASLALAITAVVRARSETKRWIPVACGGAFLGLVLLQLFLPTANLHEVLGSVGMGHPEDIAVITLRFLGVVFATPILAIPAIIGLAAGSFRGSGARWMFGIATWLVLFTVILATTSHFDRVLSTSLADSRGYHEEQLWELQRQTYAATLEKHGEEAEAGELDELALPRHVLADSRRETFFAEFPPPSVLKALLTNTLFQNNDGYSERVRVEIYEKHRAECEAEGIRLANEKLRRKD